MSDNNVLSTTLSALRKLPRSMDLRIEVREDGRLRVELWDVLSGYLAAKVVRELKEGLSVPLDRVLADATLWCDERLRESQRLQARKS